MNQLKAENVSKCVSLLNGFIKNAEALSTEKNIAVLALEQLKRVTAGSDSGIPGCLAQPRIFG